MTLHGSEQIKVLAIGKYNLMPSIAITYRWSSAGENILIQLSDIILLKLANIIQLQLPIIDYGCVYNKTYTYPSMNALVCSLIL